MNQFAAWPEVIRYLHGSDENDPGQDEVLRAIIRAQAKEQDPRWKTILLLVFWPALEIIHRQRRTWERDMSERWQNVLETFLRFVTMIDVEQRPARLAAKVFNDVTHHLHDECRRVWRRNAIAVATKEEELEELAGAVDGPDISDFEPSAAPEVQTGLLRRLLDAGHINEADFEMLVETRVRSKSLASYAREKGMDYQAAKKRRQRAEAAIRCSSIARSAS